MPELPDVENIKQYIDSTSLHKKISRVEIKDPQILNNAPQTLKQRIESHAFESTERIGKYLFISAGSETWLTLHFGMTGGVNYQESGDYPDYSRVVFHFQKNGYLAYTSQRKLGFVEVTNNLSDFKERKKLGKDALEVDLKTFRTLLNNKKGMIKSALMNQKVIAGLGNIYTDELLYQSRIHPQTKVNKLSGDEIKELHKNMKRILKTAINNHAEPNEMPDHYLITHRSENEQCPDCNGKIERVKISGRSSYYCPNCQKKD